MKFQFNFDICKKEKIVRKKNKGHNKAFLEKLISHIFNSI